MPRNILTIEDDAAIRRGIVDALTYAGYQVCESGRGDEGLQMAVQRSFDLLLLDLVLPGRDGWEVLKELKADSRTAGVPLIIVSLIDNHELGFALGADDYFQKPLDRARFLMRLKELLPEQREFDRSSVLVIDDDLQVHDYLDVELSEAGYRVHSATGGREGIGLAHALRPDVIILDLIMDGIDGFQTAAELSHHPETAQIPILVFTSRETPA